MYIFWPLNIENQAFSQGKIKMSLKFQNHEKAIINNSFVSFYDDSYVSSGNNLEQKVVLKKWPLSELNLIQ